MGAIRSFLGIAIQRSPSSFFLSQEKYAKELLEWVCMENYKAGHTPIDTNGKLPGTSRTKLANPSEYRNLAEALQYLTVMRPDLSYAVQHACLHMHSCHCIFCCVMKCSCILFCEYESFKI
jgi:hypothetical protein